MNQPQTLSSIVLLGSAALLFAARGAGAQDQPAAEVEALQKRVLEIRKRFHLDQPVRLVHGGTWGIVLAALPAGP